MWNSFMTLSWKMPITQFSRDFRPLSFIRIPRRWFVGRVSYWQQFFNSSPSIRFRSCCPSRSTARRKSTISCASAGSGTRRPGRTSGKYSYSCSGKIWGTNPTVTHRKTIPLNRRRLVVAPRFRCFMRNCKKLLLIKCNVITRLKLRARVPFFFVIYLCLFFFHTYFFICLNRTMVSCTM